VINIDDYIANIRYLLNQCVDQADKVHDRMHDLDVETIRLNVQDLSDQVNVVQAELKDVTEKLENYLKEDDPDDLDHT
jgi:DNA repair ATPase RecN